MSNEYPDQQPFEALLRLTEDGAPEERAHVASEIGRRGQKGDPRAVPALIRMLTDEGMLAPGGPGVAEFASDALVRIGRPAVEPLIETLRNESLSSSARSMAARTLGNIGDEGALDALVTVLLALHESVDVRRIVAFYLGRLGDHRATGPLLSVLADAQEDDRVRFNAAWALSELKDPTSFEPLMELLHREDQRLQTPEMRRELERMREQQRIAEGVLAEQLADLIRQGEQGRSLHALVLDAVRPLRDPRSLDLLLPLLAADDGSVRVSVAAVLGDLGEPAIGPLLGALRSEESRVREGAATALGFAHDPRTIEPLVEVLRHDESAEVRAEAASSLGFIVDERVLDPLAQALQDKSVRVRQNAASALFSLGLTGHADARVLPALEWAAEHDEGTIYGHYVVREAAERAIREIRGRPSSPGPFSHSMGEEE